SRGEDWVSPAVRTAMRAAGFGTALMVAARTAPEGHPSFGSIAAIRAAVTSPASPVALARIAPLGGLFVVPESARRVSASIPVAVVGAVGAAVPALAELAPSVQWAGPWAIDFTTSSAAAFALTVTLAASLRLRRVRRCDLGAFERMSAVLAVAITALP